MHLKAKRAATAVAERDPQIEQLPGRLDYASTLPQFELQARFVARRLRLTPTFSALVAQLAFGGGEASRC
jgi:hypothetical protein